MKAEPRAFGQFLLRKPRCDAIAPQERAEVGRAGFATVFLHRLLNLRPVAGSILKLSNPPQMYA